MIAYFYSPNIEANVMHQWDAGLLTDFLMGELWRPPNFETFAIKEVRKLSKCDRALVAIPAAHNYEYVDEINKELNKIDRVVLFLNGDEENKFDVDAIDHPNIEIWVQYAHPDKHNEYNRYGTGYPAHMSEHMKEMPYYKVIDVFFSGQLVHKRRMQMWDKMKRYEIGHECKLEGSKGFAQGLEHGEYYRWMSKAKFAPAPSGTVHPDSFRFFEALECMALVLADEESPSGHIKSYWEWMFKQVLPVIRVHNWESSIGYMNDAYDEWDQRIQAQTVWWINWKRNFSYTVMEQLLA
jgi:hypothetical protein